MAIFYRKYDPRKDQHYMSENMKLFFKKKLFEELQQLIEEDRTLSLSLVENTNREADVIDQGAMEELRFNCNVYQEHETNLRNDVESALRRLENGTYGFCAATGRPIGVERLLAAPYAMYCFQIQSEREENWQGSWN